LSLDFVCKILDVKKEGFASFALSNIINEEFDWICHNGFEADPEVKKAIKRC